MSDTSDQDQRDKTAADDTQPHSVGSITPELVTAEPNASPSVLTEVDQVQSAIDAAEATVPPPSPALTSPSPADSVSADSDTEDVAGSDTGEVAGSDTEDIAGFSDQPSYLRFDCTQPGSDLTSAAEAARVAVERGELVVLPTDTVYGIGADAFNPEAVQRLLDAKVRGRDMPPPVLIADPSLIRALAVDIPASVEDLVAKHWPGPLTVICKARSTLRMDLGDTEGTVALRVPDHDLARDLLRRTGPLAVSSANITGLAAATSCDEAIDQLGASVAVYLDGGVLGNGQAAPSTIVDFTQDDNGEVLRHGALIVAALRETLPDLVDLVEPDPDAVAAAPEPDIVDAGELPDDELAPAELVNQESIPAQLSDQPAVPAVIGEGEETHTARPIEERTTEPSRAGAHALEPTADPGAEGTTEHPAAER